MKASAPPADPLDPVFRALAHAERRRMLDIVRHRPGCIVGEVCAAFSTSRVAVMKHLKVLEEAGLLVSRRRGRTRELFFNVVPIQMIHDRWSDEYGELWARSLVDLKYRIEDRKEQS
jgi:DNA-binding transcriptional ArsR family regulator